MEEGDGTYVKQPRVFFPHAFKFLAPDSLTGAIIGAKGAGIQEIQDTTETKISVADKDSKYATTNMRIVLIRAHTVESMDQALCMIIDRLPSAKENPTYKAINNGVDEIDLVGKNEGEFKFKCLVPKAAAGGVIGTKGANIKELGDTTQCRIRVEVRSQLAKEIRTIEERKGGSPSEACVEQVVSLLGTLESLQAAVVRVNFFVQECSNLPYFQNWAHLSSSMPKGWGKGRSGATLKGKGWDRTPIGEGDMDDDLLLLRNTLQKMPRHLTDSQTFALQACLPVDKMSGLIGKAGSGTKEINQETGAKVTLRDDAPNCTVMIEGTLAGTLSAYMLVMKRFLELAGRDDDEGGYEGQDDQEG